MGTVWYHGAVISQLVTILFYSNKVQGFILTLPKQWHNCVIFFFVITHSAFYPYEVGK